MQRTELLNEECRLTAMGLRLRQAREALQITETSAARQLFLTVGQVRALEEARYEQLPAEVFVRGYLRSYARLLGLDPEEILRQYSPPSAPVLTAVPSSPDSAPGAPESSRTEQPFVSSGGSGHRSAGLLQRLRQQLSLQLSVRRDRLKTLTAAGVRELDKISDRTLMVLSGAAIVVVIGIVAALLFLGGDSADDRAAEGGARGVQSASDQNLIIDPELFRVMDEATQIDVYLPRAGDQAGAGVPASFSGSAVVSGDEKLLEIEFSADCWVEVKDSSRKILLADMRSAGDREVFHGEPPYKVLLGRTEAVVIRYGGKLFPITSDEGKDYTRVVIGG
jgi:cytoskeleton protein RodZ